MNHFDDVPMAQAAIRLRPKDADTPELARQLAAACREMRNRCLGQLYAAIMDDKARRFEERAQELG